MFVAISCCCTFRFVSELIVKPEDNFFHGVTHNTLIMGHYQLCLYTRAVLDIANPIDPIDRSIRILNRVVAMERDEALHRRR